MKKLIVLIILLVLVIAGAISAYYIVNKDAIKFKSEYEKINNQTFEKDKKKEKYIEVKINKNNPIIYLNSENVLNKIKSESKMILFGNEKDNATRKVIDTLFKVASDNGVDKIYYYKVEDNEKINNQIIEIINDSNIKELKTPLVIVVNKEKVVSYHYGTDSSSEDSSNKLTKEEENNLYKIYENMVLDLIMCTDDC